MVKLTWPCFGAWLGQTVHRLLGEKRFEVKSSGLGLSGLFRSTAFGCHQLDKGSNGHDKLPAKPQSLELSPLRPPNSKRSEDPTP